MLNYIAFILSPLVVEFAFLLACKKSLNNDPKLRKRFLIIMGIVIFIMLGFKSVKVGSGDAIAYFNNWNEMRQVPFNRLMYVLSKIDLEPGYLIAVWCLSHIFAWQQVLFIVYGAFVAFAVCRFLYLNVRDLCLGVVMFSTLGLFNFMVQGLRQGIAICFCLLALEMSKKRKIIPFFLLVLVAMLFHATAVVFVIVYFIPFLKMNIPSFIIFGICVAVLFLAIDRVFAVGNTLINDSYAIGETQNSQGGFITLAVYILIIAAAVLFADKREEHLNLFFFMTVCGAITFSMRYGFTSIIQRIAYYFMIAQSALLSSAIKLFKDRQRYVIRTGIIVLCLGIAFYKMSYLKIIPYIFFWQ